MQRTLQIKSQNMKKNITLKKNGKRDINVSDYINDVIDEQQLELFN